MSRRDEMSRLLIAIRGDRRQQDLAALAGTTQRKVSRLERGEPPPLDAVRARAYGEAAGATPAQIERLVELANVATAGHMHRRAVLLRSGAVIQARIRDYVAAAAEVWTWTSDGIPAALQTPAWTRAMLAGDGVDEPDDGDWWRTRRQHVALLDDRGRRWRVLLFEGSLRWQLGSPADQASQVRHITQVSEEFPHVDVGVLTLDSPKPAAAAYGFVLYLGGPGGDVGETASDIGTHFATADVDVGFLRERFEQLWSAAATGAAGRQELERIARLVGRGR